MALTRMGGILDSPQLLAQVGTVFSAIKAPLERFKAQHGTPMGVSVTLDNGVVGHFTPDGLFQIDSTPPDLSAAAQAAGQAAASRPTATPSNTLPFTFAPPASPPSRAPSYAPGAAPSSSAPPSLFSLRNVALAAGGGLALFLIARRL